MSKKFYRATSESRGSKLISNICAGLLLPGVVSVFMFVGCTGETETFTDSGYKYQVHDAGDGRLPDPGDYVFFHMRMMGDDSLLFDTRNNPIESDALKLPEEGQDVQGYMKGVLDVVAMLRAGDSGWVEIPIDSFQPAPAQLKPFQKVRYQFAVTKISNPEEYQADREAKQAAADEKRAEVASKVEQIFADYRSGALDAQLQETPSGLQYVIHDQGTGPNAVSGQAVTAHYYGVFAEDGTMFDSSWLKGNPFRFTIDNNEAIAGWDEGFKYLNKGAAATLFVPNELAYGERGYPPTIAPNTDLIFYVEVVDIE